MMALKATKVKRTDVLFNEIGLVKSNINWNQERLDELVLLALEETFSNLILLDVKRKDYKKAFDNYQRALKEAQYLL